jgi:hypothetical protein
MTVTYQALAGCDSGFWFLVELASARRLLLFLLLRSFYLFIISRDQQLELWPRSTTTLFYILYQTSKMMSFVKYIAMSAMAVTGHAKLQNDVSELCA